MKKVLILTLSVLALAAVQYAKTAWAEGENQGTCRQALEEVKKTGAIMERAAPIIRQCEKDSAKVLFGRALRLQAAAREALSNRHCLEALRLTAGARRHTFAALKLCGDNSGDSSAPIPDASELMLKD